MGSSSDKPLGTLRVHVRVTPELRDRVAAAANAEGRSFSAEVSRRLAQSFAPSEAPGSPRERSAFTADDRLVLRDLHRLLSHLAERGSGVEADPAAAMGAVARQAVTGFQHAAGEWDRWLKEQARAAGFLKPDEPEGAGEGPGKPD